MSPRPRLLPLTMGADPAPVTGLPGSAFGPFPAFVSLALAAAVPFLPESGEASGALASAGRAVLSLGWAAALVPWAEPFEGRGAGAGSFRSRSTALPDTPGPWMSEPQVGQGPWALAASWGTLSGLWQAGHLKVIGSTPRN